MQPPVTQRQVLLAARPRGPVGSEHFRVAEGAVRPPGEGEVLLRNRLLSIDPAIRGWMVDGNSYMPPIGIGQPIRSGVLGQVVASRRAGVDVGDHVVALAAWEEWSTVGPRGLVRSLGPSYDLPLACALSVAGGNGLAAYFGLLDVGRPVEGETLLVSAAAGGVGSVVGQLGRRVGCRVVGIAGGAAKCRYLVDSLGFDEAIDRHARGDLAGAIREACPGGVDVYFDTVGGRMLEAAIDNLAVGARVVLCGAIAQLESTQRPPGPSNLVRLLTQRAHMQGFVSMDYRDRWPEASAQLEAWVREGVLCHREHRIRGLEQAPAALRLLLDGGNLGKVVVAL